MISSERAERGVSGTDASSSRTSWRCRVRSAGSASSGPASWRSPAELAKTDLNVRKNEWIRTALREVASHPPLLEIALQAYESGNADPDMKHRLTGTIARGLSLNPAMIINLSQPGGLLTRSAELRAQLWGETQTTGGSTP